MGSIDYFDKISETLREQKIIKANVNHTSAIPLPIDELPSKQLWLHVLTEQIFTK